jgi:hypothetical protein
MDMDCFIQEQDIDDPQVHTCATFQDKRAMEKRAGEERELAGQQEKRDKARAEREAETTFQFPGGNQH